MKSQGFDLFDHTSILGFNSGLKLTCGSNGIQEGSNLWLLHFSMDGPAAADLNAHITFTWKVHDRHKGGAITSYCEPV